VNYWRMQTLPNSQLAPKLDAGAGDDEHVKSIEGAVEGNVICCLFACLCGPAMDALCALPGAVLSDVPVSLRTTSLVLTSLLGAPAIRSDTAFVLEQRAFVAVLLGVCAFTGLNRAETSARNADAILAFVGTLAVVMASSMNVAMQQKDPSSQIKRKSKEHLSALCGALLFYLGMRVLRHSFALANEISTFKVSHDDFTTRGYGVAVEGVVLGNSFAGASTIGFACILLLNHDLVLHFGSAGLSNIAGAMACFVFTGAFAAQIASFAAMEKLPSLFSSNSCDGSIAECAAAFRARRLFTASSSTSTSWICAIALSFFGFSRQKRFYSRREHSEFKPEIYSVFSLAVVGSFVVCAAVLFAFDDSNTSQLVNIPTLELQLLLISIPMCVWGWPSVACIVHATGQTLYIANKFSSGGYDFSYFTHWSLLTTVVLTVVVAILSFFSFLLYSFDRRRLYSDPVERVNAICVTALVSVQTFLTLSTLGMSSGYTGVYYDGGGSWRLSGFEFTAQHCISFFFVACLYGCRYEHAALSSWWTRLAYFALPPMMGIGWIICISAASSSGSPYKEFVDEWSFVIGVSASLASWIGVGVFIK